MDQKEKKYLDVFGGLRKDPITRGGKVFTQLCDHVCPKNGAWKRTVVVSVAMKLVGYETVVEGGYRSCQVQQMHRGETFYHHYQGAPQWW